MCDVPTRTPRASALSDIEVFVQPQVDLADGRVVGYEALARRIDPFMGPLRPRHFMPALASVSTEHLLWPHVLDASAAAARHLQQRVSVNVTGSDLRTNDLVAQIDGLDLDPRLLTIEITEHASTADVETAAPMLVQLRDRGVRISLDDFGLAESCLHRLVHVDVDEIKLDRSIVSLLTTNHRACLVAASVIDIARRLGVLVVAEGIEDPETAALAAELGCPVGQGFVWAHAAPPTSFRPCACADRAA